MIFLLPVDLFLAQRRFGILVQVFCGVAFLVLLSVFVQFLNAKTKGSGNRFNLASLVILSAPNFLMLFLKKY